MKSLFERYLTKKKEKNEKVKIYLKASQQVPDRNHRGESKINNLMLTGNVDEVDSEAVVLENQECLIPFSSILSVKPDHS